MANKAIQGRFRRKGHYLTRFTSDNQTAAEQPLSRPVEQPVLDLSPRSLKSWPFKHVVAENFVRSDVYRELVASFPECPATTGPTGFSCYWGSEMYDQLIETNWAWNALFQSTHSQEFVAYALEQFRDVYRDAGCLIDLRDARFVPYCESAEDKERRHLKSVELAPNELWVRTDIHQGRIGYERRPHVDHRRRLISMLIYLCDKDENQMEGGELVLHPTRFRRIFPFKKTVVPRHNRMAVFACPADSIHSVPPIREQAAPRNFIQITVSSSVDAWPT